MVIYNIDYIPVFTGLTDYDNSTLHIPVPPAIINTLASLDTSIPP